VGVKSFELSMEEEFYREFESRAGFGFSPQTRTALENASFTQRESIASLPGLSLSEILDAASTSIKTAQIRATCLASKRFIFSTLDYVAGVQFFELSMEEKFYWGFESSRRPKTISKTSTPHPRTPGSSE